MRNRARFAAAGALLCLAACGSGTSSAPGFSSAATIASPSPPDLALVLSAIRLTLATSSAFSLRLDATAVFGGTPKPITGNGVFDFASSHGRAQLNQPTGLERVIFVPESVFVSEPHPASGLPPGKVWVSAGLTEQSLATNVPQFVTRVESLNPGLALSEVQWGAESAAPIAATGQIRGYAVQVDLAQAEARAAGPAGQAFRRAIGFQLTEMSGATVPTQITVDLGIDPQGRVVLLRSSPPGAGTGTVTTSLSQFGTPVDVAQPAKAQIADISSLAPGPEGENAGGGDPDGG